MSKQKTVVLFHGTTKENYLSIVENGFKPSLAELQTWNCSHSQDVYFYDIRKSEQFYEYEQTKDGDYLVYAQDDCIQKAFHNAAIAASVQKSLASELFVFRLEVPLDLVQDDWSCENMSDVASVVSVSDLSLDMVKTVYKSNNYYSPSVRLFLLAPIIRNGYLTIPDLTSFEIDMVAQIANCDNLYIEPETEWTILE